MSLSDDLRAAADSLQALEGHGWADAWEAVCSALSRGNGSWRGGIGKSALQYAVIEIDRLYAIESMIKKSLPAPTIPPQKDST